MKEMKTGQKMRWIAALLYGIFALVLLFCMRFFLMVEGGGGITVTSLTAAWVFNLLLIPAAGAMSAWLFSSKEYLSAKVQRAVLAGTFFLVAYMLVSYTAMAESIRMMLTVTFQLPYERSIWELVLIVVQVMLLVLGAFFVSSAGEKKETAQDAVEAGEDAGLEVSNIDTDVQVIVDDKGSVVEETVVETTLLSKPDAKESEEK